MKKLSYILILCFLVQPFVSESQDAPVTTTGVITNATTSGSVIAPITVINFSDIGSFTLTLNYMANLVTYAGASPDPVFAGISVTNSVAGLTGTLLIVWSGTANITLPDQAHLLDLTFTYSTGTSSLLWAYTNGSVCQYKKYAGGGTYITLIDTPRSAHYINGGISNRGAPVTYAPVISNAAPGTCAVPLTVTNFTNIGAFSLKLEYDSSCLVYLNSIPNTIFSGGLAVGISVGLNGKKIITLGYYSGSATLPDGSTLITLNFTYSNGPGSGNYSALNWYDIGETCEYSDGAGDVLIDIPTANYYKNGLVFTQCAPQTSLPSITAAIPANPVNIPVTITNFSNVTSFILSFKYDPLVLSYTGFIPNPAFGSNLNIVNNSPGTDGKRKMVISWSGVSPLSLPDGSSLVTLNYTYLSGTTNLAWVISDNTSCRYNDANGNAYYDQPKSSDYRDGLVASHVAPHTMGWHANPTNGQSITVPVKVTNFSSIGYISLTMYYDPGIVTYQGATLVPSIGGSFTTSNPESGQIVLGWSSGSSVSLPDSSTLVNLAFHYISGNTTLAFYDNGNSCKYAEGSSLPSLYDLPTPTYYINGFIGPNLLNAGFTVDDTIPVVNNTLHFTDLSTGGPTAWNWSFSPATVTFVDGTNAASQSPHVLIPVNGVYSVTLTVTKGILTSSMTKTNYIHAGTPGLWTGITSTGWNTASNWHNYLVPVNVTNVHIPSTAPNWPSFTGDLTAGTHCNNLTLTGTSQLTVTGSFTINTGHSLTFTGSGTLKVGGNWSDSGSFITGTGSVEFFGANPASILAPANETFYNLIENKTSTTFTIPHNVTINGDVTVK